MFTLICISNIVHHIAFQLGIGVNIICIYLHFQAESLIQIFSLELWVNLLVFTFSYYVKVLCLDYWLQTTIDFLILLSYKTGHFGGLYKIP